MPKFGERLQHAWNAFRYNETEAARAHLHTGSVSTWRPDRVRPMRGSEKSIVVAVYNRIAIDVAATTIQHVRLDEHNRFVDTIDSGLNRCLTLEANLDQTGRAFVQDIVMTMLDNGVVSITPTDTEDMLSETTTYDIKEMRTGIIREWFPEHVRINIYNPQTGHREDVLLPKRVVGIVENPLYATVNEPNAAMQRLIRKLALLDYVDEQSGNGKLDLIIQLPYSLKSQARKDQAEVRRKDIEAQLTGSKYGIAYIDSTEHITQLNRSLENNLAEQVKNLTAEVFSQLGITMEILNGTADEQAMLNYYNRTIEPIVGAIVDEMKRKFLTDAARSRKQTIMYYRDPFKMVPVSQIAEIADKFTRNEIMSSNEIRQIIGMKPSDDPKADELRNKNLNPGEEQTFADIKEEEK